MIYVSCTAGGVWVVFWGLCFYFLVGWYVRWRLYKLVFSQKHTMNAYWCVVKHRLHKDKKNVLNLLLKGKKVFSSSPITREHSCGVHQSNFMHENMSMMMRAFMVTCLLVFVLSCVGCV